MTYVSLYRKWRPQTFSQVVGQDHISKTLTNAIVQDRVGHAYLFAGPRGTGKTSTAKILAKALNCESGPTPEPCGKCEPCKTIASGTSLDVIEMDAASNRGIDDIRELREKVGFSATGGRRKVYIVDEVHMLTEPAFNALLKTLEEPPPHVVFVLATTDPNKVPQTILSRCQHFEFRRIDSAALTERLAKIAKSEKISISDEALAIIARQAEGGLRDAIGMLDQLAGYTDKTISGEDASTFLGLIDSALVEQCVDIIIADDVGPIFDFVLRLTETGRDLRQFTGALLAHIRDIFVLSHVDGAQQRKLLVNGGDEAIERLVKQGEALGPDRTRSFLSEVNRLYDSIQRASEPRLALELMLIGLARGEELTLQALAARLDRLESGEARPERAVAQPSARPAAVTSPAPAPSRSLPGPASSEEPETTSVETKPRRPAPAPRASVADAEKPPPAVPVDLGDLDLEKIRSAWGDILSQAKAKQMSLGAFLSDGRPTAFTGDTLEITFGPNAEFACEGLGKPAAVKALTEVLAEALGKKLEIALVVGADAVSEAPVKPKAAVAPKAEVVDEAESAKDTDADVLGLLKASFGAEVVDESVVDTEV